MSTHWEVTENQLLLYRGNTQQPFKHSVRIQQTPLSFRYWDDLAWAVRMHEAKQILVLGLGGGTVLQLLHRWGTIPTCVAVEIDAELIETMKQRGWLTYPRLHILQKDARQFVREYVQGTFDAIVVDLYDEYGFVQEVYHPPLVQRVASLLSPRGVLLMHCLDPAVKYFALNLVPSTQIPSIAYAVACQLQTLSMEVEIYPLWSSALVLARWEHPSADYQDDDLPIELQWLSRFFHARYQNVQTLSRFFAPLHANYTYTNLERIDAGYMRLLVQSLPAEMGEALKNMLGIEERESRSQQDGQIWERQQDGLKPVTVTTIQAVFPFIQLLETEPGHQPETEHLVDRTLQAAHRASSNPAFQLIASFTLAWGGRWKEALGILDTKKA